VQEKLSSFAWQGIWNTSSALTRWEEMGHISSEMFVRAIAWNSLGTMGNFFCIFKIDISALELWISLEVKVLVLWDYVS
jgi:hypothetical protein